MDLAQPPVDLNPGATLTRHQWEALRRSFNLADGHSRQDQTEKQLQIFEELPALFEACLKADQEAVEAKFMDAFFDMAGQPSVFDLPRPNLHYSASISIAVAAAHLRATGGTILCIHPTFDNIPALLSRHGVPVRSIEFSEIVELESFPGDVTALVMVLPNNPTGECLDSHELLKVARLCAKHDVDLVIDFSFRFASGLCEWDQYAVLASSGARFLCIEDTGKTWPVLDLKVGMTIGSPEVAKSLQEITEDYILNISPFLLLLLTRYIESDPERSWLTIAQENRQALKEAMAGSTVVIEDGGAATIAWLNLGEDWDSDPFCRWANEKGVAVCPGGPFFWADPKRGRSYVRVALLRPKEYFADATVALRALIEGYGGTGADVPDAA